MSEYSKTRLNEIRDLIATIGCVVSDMQIHAPDPDNVLTRHFERIHSSVNKSNFIIDNLGHPATLDDSSLSADDPAEVKSNTLARLNELREPLSVINSSMFLLKNKFKDNNGNLTRHIDEIQTNVNQIVSILDNARSPVLFWDILDSRNQNHALDSK